jgi:hypothetical protein
MSATLKLLRTPSPYYDESFKSYLLRISEENGFFDKVSWILELAGIKKKDIVMQNEALKQNQDLRAFLRLIGINAEELESSVHRSISLNLDSQKEQTIRQKISRYMIRTDRPKYCPACLREGNYFRWIWDYAPVTACPIHKCLLYDECPSCLIRLTWRRSQLGLCNCGYEFKTAPLIHIRNEGMFLVNQIYALCGMPMSSEEDKSDNPLYSLDLPYLLNVVFFMAGQIHGIVDIKGKTAATSFRNIHLHYYLMDGFSVFENWPTRFFRFLEELRIRNNGNGESTGIRQDFGSFNRNLLNHFHDSEFDFMKTVYGIYLSQQWDGGYLNQKHKILSKQPICHKKYVTKQHAQEILHVKEKELKRLLETGRMIGITRKMKSRTMYLLEYNSVQAYVKNSKECYVDLPETVMILGIGHEAVAKLAKTGLLGSNYGKGNSWRFQRIAVEDLLRRIEEKIKKYDGDAQEILDMRTVLRKLTGSKLCIINYVQGILAGDLVPCGRGTKKGLAGLLHTKRNITEYLGSKLRHERRNLYSLTEVAPMMGLKEEVAYFLAKKGLFSIAAETNGTQRNKFVTIEAIDSFNATYTTLTELAKKNYTSPKCLVRILIRYGIEPVSGPTIDGGRQYIFKKEDLKAFFRNLPF